MKRILLTALLVMLVALPVAANSITQQDVGAGGISLLLGLCAVGLVVNEASLAALYKNFITIFNEAISAYEPQWSRIALEVPSTTAQENYSWMGAFPKMREWVGDRVIKNLEAFNWVIANKEYEDTIEVKRTTIEDDQYGIFRPIIRAQAVAAASLWDDLVFDLLNNGFANKGYDGKTFFATDHKSGSNKDSGAGSALSATSFGNAIAKIKRVKDTQGKPLFNGSEKLMLCVPAELEEAGRILMNNEFISVSGGSTQNNIWKGAAELHVSPKLTSATAWFICVDFNGLKPFIAQVRKQPEFVAKEDPKSSDYVFMRNAFLYGTYARGNAGYGLHQLCYGSVGA